MNAQLERAISTLPREAVVDILETHFGIQCYSGETTGELREALIEAATTDPDLMPDLD